jgi:uncharacterized membrane protein YiaA
MRIAVKILLTIAVLVISVILNAIITSSPETMIFRIVPGAVMIFGTIGVWRYKPKTEDSIDSQELDKE